MPPGFDIFDCGLRDERSNGNGSLMRIHPFSLMAYFDANTRKKYEIIIEKAQETNKNNNQLIFALIGLVVSIAIIVIGILYYLFIAFLFKFKELKELLQLIN